MQRPAAGRGEERPRSAGYAGPALPGPARRHRGTGLSPARCPAVLPGAGSRGVPIATGGAGTQCTCITRGPVAGVRGAAAGFRPRAGGHRAAPAPRLASPRAAWKRGGETSVRGARHKVAPARSASARRRRVVRGASRPLAAHAFVLLNETPLLFQSV